MQHRLENKIDLVTGAAPGIGAAIARAFVAEGAVVFVTDLENSDGPGLADELGECAIWLALDVRDETQWYPAMAEVTHRAGRLDIVVNNAGITGLENPDAGPHDSEHCTLEAWRAVHRTNLDGVFLGCRNAIRAMRPHGTGSIIKEPLNNSARARRSLCGRLRLGLGKRGLVIPNKRAQTRRRPRRGPSRKGFAGEAASRALRHSAVATATVTRVAPHDLRLLRLKRAPCRVIQRFLNISSRLGLVGIPAAAAYASSKSAVRNHTKWVALYCAEQGLTIRCNSIHPAAILTPMWEPMLGQGAEREANMAAFVADCPLRRFGQPEEVAAVAVMLASDESSYITGTEFNIDGGTLAGSAATAKPAE